MTGTSVEVSSAPVFLPSDLHSSRLSSSSRTRQHRATEFLADVLATWAQEPTSAREMRWLTNCWGAEKKGEWLVCIDRMV